MKYFWANGKITPKTELNISPVDHGIVTGDGLFETLAAYNGKVFALTRHLARLKNSAQGMLMPTDFIEKIQWRDAIESLMAANGLQDARVRITVTTGEADLGSDRGSNGAWVMIAAGALPKQYPEGKLAVVPWPRNERGALSGYKTTSYGENVKALHFAKQKGANEALFLNLQGNVCEGTGTNVAWITKGKLFTPELSTGCLAGITRALVLNLAKEMKIPAEEVSVPLNELLGSDEVMLVSTLRDVQWVSMVDEKKWERKSGGLVEKLREKFIPWTRSNLDP